MFVEVVNKGLNTPVGFFGFFFGAAPPGREEKKILASITRTNSGNPAECRND